MELKQWRRASPGPHDYSRPTKRAREQARARELAPFDGLGKSASAGAAAVVDEDLRADAGSAEMSVPLSDMDYADFDQSVWQGVAKSVGVSSSASPRAISLGDISGGARSTGYSAAINDVEGVLEISQQPAAHGRFRYSKEGRKTSLPGSIDGSFPTVQLTPAYRQLVRNASSPSYLTPRLNVAAIAM
jgi:hypothetical protein